MQFLRAAALLVSMLGMFGSAYAAPVIAYGDDVCFSYDDATLYGTGTVVGNNIFFTPSNFIASSANGIGPTSVSQMLNIQVVITTPGYWLQDLSLQELGDYQLSGAGSTVDIDIEFEVSSNTSAYSDSHIFDAGALTVQGSLTNWNAGSAINLADTVGWETDTDVTVAITNTLTADTDSLGDLAQIQKKAGGVGIIITAVPVPAAVWLFGSGLLALFGWARRSAVSS